MSDIFAAIQSASNGEMIERLTEIAINQSEIIEQQKALIEQAVKDIDYLKK